LIDYALTRTLTLVCTWFF